MPHQRARKALCGLVQRLVVDVADGNPRAAREERLGDGVAMPVAAAVTTTRDPLRSTGRKRLDGWAVIVVSVV
jgi:hypothetical protein